MQIQMEYAAQLSNAHQAILLSILQNLVLQPALRAFTKIQVFKLATHA
jgi:hypothetical protein